MRVFKDNRRNNILDNTSVHPESYKAAKHLLDKMSYTLEDVNNKKLAGLDKKVQQME